jgi:hypothetical protein
MNTINEYVNQYVNIPIILIEPRKKELDQINMLKFTNKQLYDNVIVISKLLYDDNKAREITLYADNDNNYTVTNTNKDFIKEKVFTTSLYNIVTEYKIQNIKSIVFNLNIDNIKNCLDNGYCFSHIITYIYVSNETILERLKTTKTMSEFFIESKMEDNDKSNLETNLKVMEHKNLHIPLPKITMYIIDDIPNEIKDKFDLLVAQYNINVCLHKTYTCKKAFNKNFVPIHDHIVSCLDDIFCRKDKKDTIEEDIIIQFNPKYLLKNEFFQIRYPLKNNMLYVYKDYDIIYGTKNCIHMLYQIIKSTYFTEHIDILKAKKKVTFNLFCKQYFYEYVHKIFDTKT